LRRVQDRAPKPRAAFLWLICLALAAGAVPPPIPPASPNSSAKTLKDACALNVRDATGWSSTTARMQRQGLAVTFGAFCIECSVEARCGAAAIGRSNAFTLWNTRIFDLKPPFYLSIVSIHAPFRRYYEQVYGICAGFERCQEMTPWRVSLNSIDVVVLEPEPRLYAQLDGLIDTVRENSNQDVVLDFSAVGMLTTSGISRLMRLRSLLDGSGRRLILC